MAYLECNSLLEKEFADGDILISIDKNLVASLILNRADKHNALTSNMIKGMHHALDYLESNYPKLKVLILKASGTTFCAGADLKEMQAMITYDYQQNYDDAELLANILRRIYFFACPTIAVVQGNAYGGGVGLISCADFAIANLSAEFCLSEVRLGLIPAVISPYVIESIGLKEAKRYILTAEKFNADQALRMGMLTAVTAQVGDNFLADMVTILVKKLLNNGPMAMREAKRLLNSLYGINNVNVIEQTIEAIATIRVSEEGQEGLLAFSNKRKPNWITE